jgi:hypothetical protein
MPASQDPNQFVADGDERARGAIRTEVEAAVRGKYADELARAGFVRRMWLRWVIHREIERELEKRAPSDGLY